MKHPARLIPFDDLKGFLADEVARGNVAVRGDTHSLIQYTYTKQCVFNRAWNEITLLARGLIIDYRKEAVVATPFPKFFNYGEDSNEFPDMGYDVYEKMDGSLIILFHDGVEWRTATKGSFVSEQAVAAAQMLEHYRLNLVSGTTYLLELVGPSNKIVVPYEKDELVLLGGYQEDGEELSHQDLSYVGFPVVQKHHFTSFSELAKTVAELPATSEGFVIRFEDGYRLKMKGDAYCHVHRFIERVTPLEIWRTMRERGDLAAFRNLLPEEFVKDFDRIYCILYDKMIREYGRLAELAGKVHHIEERDLSKYTDIVPAKDMGAVRLIRKMWREKQMDTPIRLDKFIKDSIRPHANHLEGYTPSRSLKLFETESA